MSSQSPVSHPRTARPRHFLMCPPAHFDVVYSINPWMDVNKPVDAALALAQWGRLRALYRELGHRVSELTPVEGLPDMVFTANGATVVDRAVLLANFRHPQRAAETRKHENWFKEHGFADLRHPRWANEGEGDCLREGRRILAGTGFRTDPRSHGELQELCGLPVVGLTLVNPRHYHLDTALAVLGDGRIMYYPAAFSDGSRRVLRELYPDALLADDADAAAFGLNAVSDGLNVVLPQAATNLIGQLRERGYRPIGVDMSELMKAGGAVKCCTLDLGPAHDS
jgi:N-dimethylarginine dimethylaminohydrolase